MKRMKTLLIAAAIVAGSIAVSNAQNVAHIDSQALIEAMPEAKAAQDELEKIQKSYESEIMSMSRELEAKFERYEREADSQTDEENVRRAEEVQQAQAKISEYRQNAAQDLQQKESDLLSPLFDKARKAIQKVAADKGIKYVLDASPGGGLIVAEGPDLLADVKKELGI